MTTPDPRAALDRLVAALEAHLQAATRRRGEADPHVVEAYQALADAFETYDEALYTAYDEVTPFVLYDDTDDDDLEDDDEDLDDEDDDEDDDADLVDALDDVEIEPDVEVEPEVEPDVDGPDVGVRRAPAAVADLDAAPGAGAARR